MIRVARPLLALLLLFLYGAYVVHLAAHKWFWLDEGYDIIHSCATPYHVLLASGATPQCSAQPLYYLLEKIFFSLTPHFDGNLLVQFRVLSLIAGASTILVLFALLEPAVGVTLATIGVLFTLHVPAFTHYAAEARPYELWLALFMLEFWVAFRATSSPWSSQKISARLALIIASLALTLVAGPGWMQVGGFLAGILFLNWLCFEKAILKPLLFLGPLAFALAAIGIFYSLNPCGTVGTFSLENFFSVMELLFPPSFTGKVFSPFIILGFAAGPYSLLSIPSERRVSPTLSRLSLLAGAQIAVFLFCSVLVVLFHYYFIQRVFLYLVLLRSIFFVVGIAVALEFIVRKKPAYQAGAQKGLLLFTAILAALVLRMFWTLGEQSRRDSLSAKLEPPSALQCKVLGLWANSELRFWVDPREEVSYQNALNGFERARQIRKSCKAGSAAPPRFALLHGATDDSYDWFSRSDWLKISDTAPAGEPLKFCGWPAFLSPNHDREDGESPKEN